MSNICAGIGRGQMEVLNDRVEARRKMNKFYQELFADIEGVTVFTEPGSDYYSNHWLSAIIVDPKVTGKTREDLRLALLEDKIDSRPWGNRRNYKRYFSNSLNMGEKVPEKL